jgi:hypothetical protein
MVKKFFVSLALLGALSVVAAPAASAGGFPPRVPEQAAGAPCYGLGISVSPPAVGAEAPANDIFICFGG